MFVETCELCIRNGNCLIQLLGGSIHNAACLTLAESIYDKEDKYNGEE